MRNFATIANLKSNYKVVIVGGGSAGISVAAKLAKTPLFQGKQDILILEPSSQHFYQPLWTLVGGGLKSFKDSQTLTQKVIPEWTHWEQQALKKVNPDLNFLETTDGKQINYEYLVLATGIKIDWDKIPGLAESLGENGITSNYSKDSVEYTWQLIKNFKGGNAIFTQPSTPIKCAGAPQKIMYIAEENFADRGVRANSSVSFYTGMGKLFAIDKYSERLTEICKRRNINVNLGHELVSLRPEKKQAVFKNSTGEIVVDFDMIHVTPPMSAPSYIKESGLSDEAGWVAVDKETTQHTKYSNIFSLGDSSSLPTSKTAAAIAGQCGVTSQNILDLIEKKPLSAKYDGYTSCPLVTGKDSLILAEFRGPGYSGQPHETFYFDQGDESKFASFLKKEILPPIYWNFMLKGNWDGPAKYRPLLNPLNKN